MSEPSAREPHADEAAAGGADPRRPPHRWRWSSHVANGVLTLVLLLVVAALGVRFGALTPAGRQVATAIANASSVGPAGRLRVEGLEGDVFGRFTLRRLRIIDSGGAWLDARDVRADWRPLELLARRVHARSLSAADLLVARAPVMEPRPPRAPTDLPVAFRLDAVQARVRTGAPLTVAAGDWDAKGALDLLRDRRASARLEAVSRLHAGDHLSFDFDLKEMDRLRLVADAREAAGGAVAGGLGLAADRPFLLHAVFTSDDRGGRLDVDSRSGAVTPLRAVGRWSQAAGADVEAVALLAASRHTDHYTVRIGQEATLRLHATPKPLGRYDVRAVLEGPFARLTATGPFNAKTRRVEGMALEARLDDLSTWFKPPQIGPAQGAGVANGGWNDLHIEAKVAAQGLDELDTTIARLNGSLVVTQLKGEWRVVTDAVGEGIGGTGLLGPLLGPRPVTHVDLSRLPDGRVLFRRLDVTGAHLNVAAQGDITLFGDLTFRGEATAPDIRGLRPGSRGALRAHFDAASKKGSDFWTLTGEANGEAVSTGLPELDRLIGAAPRLTARGSWTPKGFLIDRADLVGAAADGSAKGTFSTEKVMDFALDWRAKGPFLVGPLEIAGAMTGDGKLTGTLARPRADLHAKLTTLDLGRLQVTPAALDLSFISDETGATDGLIAVSGPSNYGAAAAKAAFRFAARGVDLRDIVADAGGVRLGGSLALRDGEPSTADLVLAAGPGAFLTRGRLTGTVKVAQRPGAPPGSAQATLQLDGRDLAYPASALSLRRVSLRADGPLDRLPFRLEAESGDPVSWRWAGSGVLARAGAARELSLDGAGRLRSAELRTLETARLRFGPEELSGRLRLAVGGGRLSFDGRQAGDALTAQAELAGVGLGAFNEDYEGAVSGTLALNGRGRSLGGRFQAALTGARTRDAAADLALDAAVAGELAGDRLRLTTSATNAQGLKAQGRVDLPAEAAAKPFRIAVNRTRPMTGDLAVDGELRPLWDLFLGGERTVSGQLTARAAIAGTLNDPRFTGGAQVSKGAVTDTGIGLTLKNVEGSAEFGRNLVTVRRFSGDDGKGGTLSGDGSVSLARDGGSTLRVDVRRFRLFDNEYGRATTSGQVTVTRDAAGHAKLVGKLGVDRADITAKVSNTPGVVSMDVIELNAPSQAGLDPGTPLRRPSAASVALDVTIQAPRGLYVRGRGLDVELSLDAHVGGSTAAPDLTGVARVVRGSYDFSGKRFEFNEFGVIRLGTKPELIRLDLTAERNENGLDARVRVTGTAANPQIALTSIPVLPQDEILSRVLFGVSASQLSPFEAAQLAAAVTALATGGGLDVLGSLRQFAGLDRLALGGGPSGATVSGGKYLTNDVYLELTGAGNGRGESPTQNLQTGRTGSSASIEWRVRRNLSLLGQVWTGGASRLSVRFRQSR